MNQFSSRIERKDIAARGHVRARPSLYRKLRADKSFLAPRDSPQGKAPLLERRHPEAVYLAYERSVAKRETRSISSVLRTAVFPSVPIGEAKTNHTETQCIASSCLNDFKPPCEKLCP